MDYAIKAAQFATEYKSRKLPHTEWSMIPRGPPPGVPDVCIFDFTNLYAARVAARVNVRKGQPLLSMIVGDSLLEPFWPEGTGCARGFLSAMDAGWMMRDWFLGQKNPLKILAEREMTRYPDIGQRSELSRQLETISGRFSIKLLTETSCRALSLSPLIRKPGEDDKYFHHCK